VYNALLFVSPFVQNGSHTLTITTTDIEEGSNPMWIDYIQVQDAFGSTTGEQTLKVDDCDPQVDSDMFHETDSTAFPPPFNGTDSLARSEGNYMRLSFEGRALLCADLDVVLMLYPRHSSTSLE
jgi:hypothetical protein